MGNPGSDKKKKKQRLSEASNGGAKADSAAAGAAMDVDGEGPNVEGRKWTVSVALPGSLLDNPPSLEVAVCTVGQIARALEAFQVDEVVVYDDTATRQQSAAAGGSDASGSAAAGTVSPGTALLAQLLQFFDTPPHLRPNLYASTFDPSAGAAANGAANTPSAVSTSAQAQGGPYDIHRAYRLAAALPQPSPPHHARPGYGAAWMPYREGVVLQSEAFAGSYVDVGMDRMVWLQHELPKLTRVTVYLGSTEPTTRFMPAFSETMIVGEVVPPSAPRELLGLYWGCVVRIAAGLQRAFRDAAVGKSGHYDLTIGSSPQGADTDPGALVLPSFRHALLVLGGAAAGGTPGARTDQQGGSKGGKSGKEAGQAGGGAGGGAGGQLLDLDQLVQRVPDWEHKAPQDVFNLYLNTTPHLGTLRLRTEDALPIALSYLITPLLKYGKQ